MVAGSPSHCVENTSDDYGVEEPPRQSFQVAVGDGFHGWLKIEILSASNCIAAGFTCLLNSQLPSHFP